MLLPSSWYARDAVIVAKDLLGKTFRFGESEGIIVETEAYTNDAASHGRVYTPRSSVMHDTFGHWYVYKVYGMHYCVNVTTNEGGVGAVLIRAVEPIKGISKMQERRGSTNPRMLTNGPGKLCQAFGITTAENGLPISKNFGVYETSDSTLARIVSGPRIGIKKDTHLPWRFWIEDNPWVST